MTDWSDAELGMGRPITRRDFLDGVAIAAGAAAIGGAGVGDASAKPRGKGPYPYRAVRDLAAKKSPSVSRGVDGIAP